MLTLTALNTLCLIDNMKLAWFASNTINRTRLCALSASDTLVCYEITHEALTSVGRTSFVVADMSIVLVFEIIYSR